MAPGLRLTVLVVGFTVASGLLDALAFSYAAGMWRDGRLVASEAAKSASSFLLGMTMYFGAVRYLGEAGVVLAEIQTLIWFGVTIIGVAIFHGRFFQWDPLEHIVAVNVVLGLGWLISRTSAA